ATRVFTVTFVLNGGVIGEDAKDVVIPEVPVNTLAIDIKPEDPVRENYGFEGWQIDAQHKLTDETLITGDMMFYATWTGDDVTILFSDGLGHSLGASTVEYDSILTAAEFAALAPVLTDEQKAELIAAKAAQSGGQWALDPESTWVPALPENDTRVTETMVYNLNWIKVYTVRFVSLGNEIGVQSVNEGKTPVKPDDPVQEGFAFLGWYDGENLFDFENDIITRDLVLTAKWAMTAQGVENLINAIGEVTLEKETSITTAREAYDALSEGQQSLVNNYQTLLDAEAKLDAMKAAAPVIEKINAIGEPVTEDSGAAIQAAREAYDVLTDAQKEEVTNYSVLEAAEAAYASIMAVDNFVELVGRIGDPVTLNDEEPIAAAREAYDALTDDQKAQAAEAYAKLQAAEEALAVLIAERDQAAAAAVIEKINAIGPVSDVTLESEGVIQTAREAYDALTAAQQALVTNYQTLLDAEAALADLIAAHDQAAADEVIALINKISDPVTEDSVNDIRTAREAYDKLTDAQKELVTNYQKLLDAEKAISRVAPVPRLILVPVAKDGMEVYALDKNGEIVADPEADAAYVVSYIIYMDASMVTGKTTLPFDVYYQVVNEDGSSTPLSKKQITYTTNDKRIATVKANNDGTAVVTVKAKASGAATITAAVKSLGLEGSLAIHVRDYAPRIETTAVTVNSWYKYGTNLRLIPSYENAILDDGVTIDSTEFTAEYADGILNIKAVGEPNNGTYKNVRLTVRTEEHDYVFTLTITVKNAAPTVKVKQTKKFNKFYNYTEEESAALFTLASAYEITDAAFETASYIGTYADGVMTVTKKANAPAKDAAKGVLTVYFDEFTHPFTMKNFSVAAATIKPNLKLSGTSFTVNTAYGENTVSFHFLGEDIPADDEVTCVFNPDTATLEYSGGEFTMKANANKKTVGTITVNKEGWAAPLTFKVTLNVNKNLPTAKVLTGTLLLNAQYSGQTASTRVALNTTDVKLSDETRELTATGKKAAALAEAAKLLVVYQDGEITASIRDGSNLPKAGTYSFQLIPTLENGTSLKAVTVKVKVANNAAVTATVTAAGKLDAVRRDSTAITYTLTKLDSVIGEITDVQLTGANAELFDVELIDEPAKGLAQARLTLKDDVTVSTKASYKIALEFEIDGEIKATTKALAVKVTQSKAKVAVTPKTSTLFQSDKTAEAPAEYTLTLTAPAGARIEQVKLSDKTPVAFWRSLGNKTTAIVSWSPNGDGTVNVQITVKDPSKLVNGKTYSVVLDVLMEGQAENAAPVSVTVNMIVKK
ncbi:MAG: InlB B-repeat-containing protein, partial [Oscillospiraceae bacterium]|nr:InlB B-repeat-containing protein [Oscillospiraceae bacterium]